MLSKVMVYVHVPELNEFQALSVYLSPSEVRSFRDHADRLRTDPINNLNEKLDPVDCYLQVIGTYVIEEILKSTSAMLVRVVVLIGECVGATLRCSDHHIPDHFLLEMEGLVSDEVYVEGPIH